MSPHRFADPTLGAALVQPMLRLVELPLYGQILAAIGAAAAAVYADFFGAMLYVAIGAAFADYVLGRHVARRVRQDYTEAKAHAGAVSKLAGLALVLLIRSLELVLQDHGVADTGGMAAAAIICALIVKDLRSIEGHRIRCGAGPIVGLSALFSWLEEIERKLLPVPAAGAPSEPLPEG